MAMYFICALLTILKVLGLAVGEGDWRIIGGTPIEKAGIYPWLVSLKGDPTPYVFNCGASVISDRWLLSAAHCFFWPTGLPVDQKVWIARLASPEIKSESGVLDSIKGWFGKLFRKDEWIQWNIGVEHIIIHPQYKTSGYTNDIALVKLKESIPVGPEFDKISAIKLPKPTPGFPSAGQNCVMTGWGCSEIDGKATTKAMEVQLPILDNSTCLNTFRLKTNGLLCAGFFNKNIGLCRGDSGGPLVCKQGNDWVQVGVGSFSFKRRPDMNPAAFTRVSYYVDWIESVMKKWKN